MDTRLHFTTLSKYAAVRIIAASIWTLMMLITLLQSSGAPVVGQPAPPDWRLDYEIFLTSAHFITFGGFTVLWGWVFALRMPMHRAALFAFVGAILFSILTESLQTLVPDRGASLWDLGVNALAAWVGYTLLRRLESVGLSHHD